MKKMTNGTNDSKTRVNRFIDIIHKIADTMGLRVEGRVTVTDKNTGKRYD